MRYRKPVGATAAPGTTEVVVDGVTGRLAPMRDFVAIARGTRELIRDSETARRMGEAARARVEAEFRAGAMVERFAGLYEQLARAKGRDVG